MIHLLPLAVLVIFPDLVDVTGASFLSPDDEEGVLMGDDCCTGKGAEGEISG